MTGERTLWQHADAVLDDLLDLPPEAREARLSGLALTPKLHARVLRLLRAHERAAGVLERIDPPPPLAPAMPSMTGRRFGQWMVEDELGRGGMAVVYRAHHVDDVARLAALKVLTLGALVGTGATHFQREHQILSHLNHAYIAPLLDAGIADDGTPWMAMGLVDGRRIDEYCAAHALAVPARIRLCLEVCAAVAYAHQNLVIHRDLKPSNVLVDHDGHVRLLDFGIARLLDRDIDTTRTALRALSPQYAAPEQFGGALPATTMDVYGLGALLFALMTGQAPRGADEDEHPAPPLPSRLAAAEHAPALRGDLDAIVGKALAHDPRQRYPTVEALAADLQAWLEGQPVQARQLGRWARLRRRVRRHRWAIAAVAAIVLSLASGLLIALWQSQRAQREAERAVRVRDFLAEVFQASIPRDGSLPNALQILDAGSARAKDELQKTDPFAAADVLLLTGDTRRTLSDWEGGLRDLVHARELLLAQGAERTLMFVQVEVGIGNAHRNLGRMSQSLASMQQAAAIARSIDLPAEERIRVETALANAEVQTQQFESGRARLDRILDEIRQHPALRGTKLHHNALNVLSSLLATSGRPALEQIPVQEERLSILQPEKTTDPGYYAFVLADLVPTFRRAEQYQRAEALALEAVAMSERLHVKPHLTTTVASCNLGWLYLEIGRLREARHWLSRSVDMDHALDRADLHASSCLEGRAHALALLGKHESAATDFATIEAMLAKQGNARALAKVNLHAARAALAMRQGNLDAAKSLLHRAQHDDIPEGTEPTRLLQQTLAEWFLRRGDPASAEVYLKPLREQNPPHPLRRYWLKPWLLSYLAARQHGTPERADELRQALANGLAQMAPDNELGSSLRRCLDSDGQAGEDCWLVL